MRIVGGDLGGTKTLLRCVESDGTVSADERYESDAFATFDDILRAFLAQCPGRVDSACFAAAGPVFGGRADLTNLGWELRADALARTFGITHVTLINDFYAVALGVPQLADEDLHPLQNAVRDRSAPIAILGAGTGLGQAVVIPNASGWSVIPSEGGHADFAPQDESQARLMLQLVARHGHASWERVVSGMGLTTIHEFFTGAELGPEQIAALAASGDAAATRTFQTFVDIYGAEAGNMGLRVLAKGGVFLAGGIAAKNVDFFTDGRFLESFSRKGRFRELMASFPVDIILNEKVGLMGAVAAARAAGALAGGG
jgi:glucokinase